MAKHQADNSPGPPKRPQRHKRASSSLYLSQLDSARNAQDLHSVVCTFHCESDENSRLSGGVQEWHTLTTPPPPCLGCCYSKAEKKNTSKFHQTREAVDILHAAEEGPSTVLTDRCEYCWAQVIIYLSTDMLSSSSVCVIVTIRKRWVGSLVLLCSWPSKYR